MGKGEEVHQQPICHCSRSASPSSFTLFGCCKSAALSLCSWGEAMYLIGAPSVLALFGWLFLACLPISPLLGSERKLWNVLPSCSLPGSIIENVNYKYPWTTGWQALWMIEWQLNVPDIQARNPCTIYWSMTAQASAPICCRCNLERVRRQVRRSGLMPPL